MNKFDIRIFMASVRREAGEEQASGITLATLRSLLARKGEDFVREAYWQILNREVDPDGLKAFRERAGSYSGRVIITLSLLLSPERILLPHWTRRLLRLGSRSLQRKHT